MVISNSYVTWCNSLPLGIATVWDAEEYHGAEWNMGIFCLGDEWEKKMARANHPTILGDVHIFGDKFIQIANYPAW